jgi:hypothetical protein
MRISVPSAFDVERLKAEIDLAEVVERYSSAQLRKVGKRLVCSCPKHGSGDRRGDSFAVDPAKQLWHCWGSCDTGGDVIRFVEWYLDLDFRAACEKLASDLGGSFAPGPATGSSSTTSIAAPRVSYTPPPVPRPELIDTLRQMQDALPGSPGERYLAGRGVDLEQAQRFGLGYAGPGLWPGRGVLERIVFPHTDADGALVSLYGRLIVPITDSLKPLKHDHLPGPRALFNGSALRSGAGPVWVCEAPLDALALNAAGVDRVVAVFGVSQWRWDWARDARDLIVALDADDSGAKAAKTFAIAARLRGKRVAILPASAYGREKDASAALVAGELDLRGWLDLDDQQAEDSRDDDLDEPEAAQGVEQAAALPGPEAARAMLPGSSISLAAACAAVESIDLGQHSLLSVTDWGVCADGSVELEQQRWFYRAMYFGLLTSPREHLARLRASVLATLATIDAATPVAGWPETLIDDDSAGWGLSLVEALIAMLVADACEIERARVAQERALLKRLHGCWACGLPGAWGVEEPCPRCHPPSDQLALDFAAAASQ